jgi:Rod binding domain-containing protein
MTIAAKLPVLPSLANRPEVNSVGSKPETSAHKNLRKAAQEFEGILISQLLGEFKTGFSSLSGDSPLAGSETLNSLAIQTLSGAMARRGGLGIGQTLVHQLEPSLPRGEQNLGGETIKTASQD